MARVNRYVNEEVSISVRNTFLHCAVQRTCAEVDGGDDAEEQQQPQILRATTAPVPRLHDAEVELEELGDDEFGSVSNLDELDVELSQEGQTVGTAVPDASHCHGTGTHTGAVLLGRVSNGRADDGAAIKAQVEQKEKVPPLPSWKAEERHCAKGVGTSGVVADDERTTVMLRNLPNNYTRTMMLELLDAEGFAGRYDFLYIPIDFRTHAALGYGFINLVSHQDAERLQQRFEGFARWGLPSNKVCRASWSHPHQGLDSHVARYRSSPLMHPAVPDEYRPILFSNGVRVPFPPPTKKVKPPRQGTQRMLV